jgi:hypothetical protein
MKRSVSRVVMIAFACVALSGCGVAFRQIGTVQQMMPTREEPQYAWRFVFNGMETLVYPVVAEGRRVLFANRDGLRIHWDGETIYLIEGLPGSFGTYRAGVEGNERWYDRDGAKTYRLTCTPPRQWRVSDVSRGTRQECRGQAEAVEVAAHHTVMLDTAGQIRVIEATLVPRTAPVTLLRLRP